MVLKDMKFIDNSEFVQTSLIPVHNDITKQFAVDIKFLLKKELKVLKIKFSVEILMKSGDEYPKSRYHLVNQTVDFCNFLRKPASNWQISIFLREIKNYPGLPKDCPIIPKLYVLDNFTVSMNVLPQKIIPDTKFFLILEFFTIVRKRPITTTLVKVDGELHNI